MTAYADFDRSVFPLINCTFTGVPATPENFQTYLEGASHNLSLKKPFVLVFDARKVKLMGFKYQKMQADWVKENEASIAQYCKGTAYIIPGAIVRGFLKAIFALQKQPAPYQIFKDVEEGERWCRKMITETSNQAQLA